MNPPKKVRAERRSGERPLLNRGVHRLPYLVEGKQAVFVAIDNSHHLIPEGRVEVGLNENFLNVRDALWRLLDAVDPQPTTTKKVIPPTATILRAMAFGGLFAHVQLITFQLLNSA